LNDWTPFSISTIFNPLGMSPTGSETMNIEMWLVQEL
jgi:hypothetical protein